MIHLDFITDLENSFIYECAVKSYLRGHSLLLVENYSPSDSFYLTFENVRYFSGVVQWQDATVTVGSTDARDSLIQSLGLDDAWKQSLRLFHLGNVQQVKILAENILKTDEVPPNFT